MALVQRGMRDAQPQEGGTCCLVQRDVVASNVSWSDVDNICERKADRCAPHAAHAKAYSHGALVFLLQRLYSGVID